MVKMMEDEHVKRYYQAVAPVVFLAISNAHKWHKFAAVLMYPHILEIRYLGLRMVVEQMDFLG